MYQNEKPLVRSPVGNNQWKTDTQTNTPSMNITAVQIWPKLIVIHVSNFKSHWLKAQLLTISGKHTHTCTCMNTHTHTCRNTHTKTHTHTDTHTLSLSQTHTQTVTCTLKKHVSRFHSWTNIKKNSLILSGANIRSKTNILQHVSHFY